MSKYIEAEAAIKILRGALSHEEDANDAESIIRSMPAADVVEVRHGEWVRAINQKHSAKWSSKVACSVCRHQGYERYNYCPNCGADMRERKDP